MSSVVIAVVVSALGSSGIAAGIVSWLKDRRKDAATAKLTDVQALQQQVLLLTQVSDYLRKENGQLQKDYETSEESRRNMRMRMEELESKLVRVERECQAMREQLTEMKGDR